MSLLEGFVKHLKKFVAYKNVPNVITRENVNDVIIDDFSDFEEKKTLLEIASHIEGLDENLIRQLLQLGAKVTHKCLTDRYYRRYFLEMGVDVNSIPIPEYEHHFLDNAILAETLKDGSLLIDHGAKPVKPFSFYIDDHFRGSVQNRAKTLEQYATLSDRRVQECRKALLALLRICDTSSSFRRGAPFGALRDVMIQMASQVWAMRGGEGCGARGWEWFVKL